MEGTNLVLSAESTPALLGTSVARIRNAESNTSEQCSVAWSAAFGLTEWFLPKKILGGRRDEDMHINRDLLERTCKNTIEAILCCLEQATKGTVYTIGPMPRLQAERITSGVREDGQLKWGLPQDSDYNPPGKEWKQYRDNPDHLLEAMGWCVEHQKAASRRNGRLPPYGTGPGKEDRSLWQ